MRLAQEGLVPQRVWIVCLAVRTLRVRHPHCRHFGALLPRTRGLADFMERYEEGYGETEAAGGNFWGGMRIRGNGKLVDAICRGTSSNSTRIHYLRVEDYARGGKGFDETISLRLRSYIKIEFLEIWGILLGLSNCGLFGRVHEESQDSGLSSFSESLFAHLHF
jgi:hypothetical protein